MASAPAGGNDSSSSKESKATVAPLDQGSSTAAGNGFIDYSNDPLAAGLYQSWSITPAAGVNSYAGYQRQQLLEQRQQQQEQQQLIQQLEADGDMLPMQQLQQVQQVQQTRKKLPSYSSASHYGGDTDWKLLNEAAADVARFKVQQLKSGSSGGGSSSSSKSGSKRSKKRWARQLQELPGWLLYRYYNWRQDGVSDLLLITAVSTTLLITAALLKRTLVDPSDPTALLLQQQQQYLSSAAAAGSAAEVTAAAPAEAAARLTAAAASPAAPELVDSAFPASSSSSSSGSVDAVKRWLAALGTDVYQVMVLSFGENFPNPDDGVSPVEELFSIGVALSGLAGFALALALVEQVVLETNMANVKRGSPVYEAGHYLVLGWAVSQRDLELLIKLVGQLISSAAADGGATIVVLTQREKLEMEELFRRTIPPAARAGSRLVFRQGSPLLPTDLSNVAASKARSTIIISDQSRGRDEADAQSLRCAILLDELDGYRGLRKGRAMGHIVVETRTPNAVPLLRFSCSKRVIALPAGHMNARRLARMLKRPFISWVSQRLWAFDSRCSLFMHAAHDLTGTRFRSLAFLFPDAIVMGVAHMASGRVTLNPMLDYVLAADDELILCRPTAIPTGEFSHLPELLTISELELLGQQLLQQQQQREQSLRSSPLAPLLQQQQQQRREWMWQQQVQAVLDLARMKQLQQQPPQQQQLQSMQELDAESAKVLAEQHVAPGIISVDDVQGPSAVLQPSALPLPLTTAADSTPDSSTAAAAAAAAPGSSSSGSGGLVRSVTGKSVMKLGFAAVMDDNSPSVSQLQRASASSASLADEKDFESANAARQQLLQLEQQQEARRLQQQRQQQQHEEHLAMVDQCSPDLVAAAGLQQPDVAVMRGSVNGANAAAAAAAASVSAADEPAAAAAGTATRELFARSSSSSSAAGLQRSSSINMAYKSAILSDSEEVDLGPGPWGNSSSIRSSGSSNGSSSSSSGSRSLRFAALAAGDPLAVDSGSLDVEDGVMSDVEGELEVLSHVPSLQRENLSDADTSPEQPAAATAAAAAGEAAAPAAAVIAMLDGETLEGAAAAAAFATAEVSAADCSMPPPDVHGWSSLSSTLDSMDSMQQASSSISSIDMQELQRRSVVQPAAAAAADGGALSSAGSVTSSRDGLDGTADISSSSSSRGGAAGPAVLSSSPSNTPSSSIGSTSSVDRSHAVWQDEGASYGKPQQGSSSSSSSSSTAGSSTCAGDQPGSSSNSSIGSSSTVQLAPAAAPAAAAAAKDSSDSHKDTSSFNYVPREYLAVDSSPEALMVCGWSESGFMAELLYELDSGASCLPPGSEIVFVNCHPPEDTLGALLRGKTLTNVKVSHVYADPLQRNQLAALPLARFRAAIVLADAVWADPDGDERNGIDSIDQPSVLRQDSLMVMVQLNIRKLLEDLALPPINIICQKVATQGLTRFEDRRRLPLGISINFNSMAAKLLTQVAVNPLSMLVMNSFGMRADLTIVDASEYCGRGEAISFWRVLSRAQSAGDVLLGYYVLPSHIDQPIESTINPQGLAARSVQRVWNTGDGRLKFMVIRDKECEAE
uniref:Uncharacterized protein n=1 Tax=Tetradesmus obliquus TaxID=3088 RepID=A0A383W1D6_TETOB